MNWSLRLDLHQHLTAYETAALLMLRSDWMDSRNGGATGNRTPICAMRVRRLPVERWPLRMDAHPGLAPGKSVLQTGGSTSLPCARF